MFFVDLSANYPQIYMKIANIICQSREPFTQDQDGEASVRGNDCKHQHSPGGGEVERQQPGLPGNPLASPAILLEHGPDMKPLPPW